MRRRRTPGVMPRCRAESLRGSASRARNGRRQAAAVKGTDAEFDFYPVVKLFNPCGAATWLLTEIDPEDETVAWGLCDLGMGFPEFGTVSLDRTRSLPGTVRHRHRARPVLHGTRTDLGLHRGCREGRAHR
jgi:hypothetical protein